MSRSRSFTFTINNPTEDDFVYVISLPHEAKLRYFIVALEKGTKKGTIHLQCYVYFQDAITKSRFKKYFPRAHIDISRGSPQQNYEYCTKGFIEKVEPPIFHEYGTLPTQGYARMEEIERVMEDPTINFRLYAQYRRSYEEYTIKRCNDRKVDEREIEIVSDEDMFNYPGAYLFNGYLFGESMSTYMFEDVAVIPFTNFREYLIPWYRGFPPRFKRGYQVIMFNPSKVVLTCSTSKQMADAQLYVVSKVLPPSENIKCIEGI